MRKISRAERRASEQKRKYEIAMAEKRQRLQEPPPPAAYAGYSFAQPKTETSPNHQSAESTNVTE
jgi:hypothetical protein